MRKLKTIGAAALAAATLGIASLVSAPAASASYTCEQLLEVARFYIALGSIEEDHTRAMMWYARATTILEICSG